MWQNLDFPILADAKADPGDVAMAINRPSGGNRLLILFLKKILFVQESNSGQQPCRAPTMGP